MNDRRELVTRSQRGAWAEACAITFLLERGFEVFRNVSQHGPIDLVAWRDDEVFLFDVKTALCGTRRDGTVTLSAGARERWLTEEHHRREVRLLLVYVDGFCEIVGMTPPHPDVLVASLTDRPPQGVAVWRNGPRGRE